MMIYSSREEELAGAGCHQIYIIIIIFKRKQLGFL